MRVFLTPKDEIVQVYAGLSNVLTYHALLRIDDLYALFGKRIQGQDEEPLFLHLQSESVLETTLNGVAITLSNPQHHPGNDIGTISLEVTSPMRIEIIPGTYGYDETKKCH